MLEIIAVISLLGLFAVMGAMAFSPEQEDLSSVLNTFKANLRFAQALAVAQSRLTQEDPTDGTVIWGLSWTGSEYELKIDGKPSTDINLPGSSDSIITLPDDVSFTAESSIHFNYRGQPVNESETVSTDDITISLQAGSTTQTVTVIADTGFVQ